jgi:hypothetical protein
MAAAPPTPCHRLNRDPSAPLSSLYKKPRAPSPNHTAPRSSSTPLQDCRQSTAAGVPPSLGSAAPAPFPHFRALRWNPRGLLFNLVVFPWLLVAGGPVSAVGEPAGELTVAWTAPPPPVSPSHRRPFCLQQTTAARSNSTAQISPSAPGQTQPHQSI